MRSVAARLAGEALRLGRDRLARRSDVPRDLSGVTRGWLTEVLGAPVASAERLDVSSGTSARARFVLHGDGVPGSVFVKLAPTAIATRAFVDLMGLGFTEATFYRRVRPDLPVEAPRAYAVRDERSAGRFALVLEDLAARGCRFADVRATATAAEAEAVVTALARLHAQFWDSPRFSGDLSWVHSHARDPNAALIRVLVRAAYRRAAWAHPQLVPPVTSVLLERREEIEGALARGPVTLLHGDGHLGNVYFDGETPGFLDWQVVRRGHGLRDIAYFLVLSLDTELRRERQSGLLRRYLDELASRGGPAIGFDEGWRRYRAEAFYAWLAAAFTAGAGGLQAGEIAIAGLTRATAALEDLETIPAIRELIG